MELFSAVVIFLTFLTSSIDGLDVQNRAIVSPIVVEPVSGVAVYDRVFPVVFRFFYEDLLNSNLIVTNHMCNSPSEKPYCPVLYSLQDALLGLRPLVTSVKTLQKTESPAPSLNMGRDKCRLPIAQHFASLYSTKTVVQDYIEELRRCSNGVHDLDEMPIFSDSFATFYQRAHLGYYTSYYSSEPDSTWREAAYSVAIASINWAAMLHFSAETKKWETAVEQCRLDHILPSGLITTDHLRTSLYNVFLKALDKGLQLSVPPNVENLSWYWAQKGIVDCTFTSDIAKELIIRILVPGRMSRSQWSISSLQSLPFRHHFQGKTFICLIHELEDGKYVLFDKDTGKAVYPSPESCDIENSKLCFAGTSGGYRKLEANCAAAILSGVPHTEIVKHCPMVCEDEKKFNDVIARRITSDVVYLAGYSTEIFTVTCRASGDLTANLPAEGGVRVTLACGCQIQLNGDAWVSYEPCGSTTTFENVIPLHFVQENVVYGTPAQ